MNNKLDGFCHHTIWGARVTSYQCRRVWGFGPEGKYCKQHAALYEVVEAAIPLWKIENGRYQSFKMPEKVMVREVKTTTFIDKEGRRNSFRTEWELYFQSEEAALKELLSRAEALIAHSFKEVARGEQAKDKIAARLMAPIANRAPQHG